MVEPTRLCRARRARRWLGALAAASLAACAGGGSRPAAVDDTRAPSAAAPMAPASGIESHSPFAVGDCAVCHQRADRDDPGPTKLAGAQLCDTCHHEFREQLAGASERHPRLETCASCHNPHNGYGWGLLQQPATELCRGCHAQLSAQPGHDAASSAACGDCHVPHASSRAHLLRTGAP